MKRLSLGLVILAILGCVIRLSAQDEAETTYLAYLKTNDDNTRDIRGLNIDTGEDVLLLPVPESPLVGGSFSSIFPSPDGHDLMLEYAYEAQGIRTVALVWIDLATQQVTPIYQTEKRLFDPDWSPDSTHITFRTSNDDYSYENFWIYDLASDSLDNPLSAPSQMAAYEWSPDGQSMVAYIVERSTPDDVYCSQCASHIDLIDIASGETTHLLDDSAWALQPPRSSRDVLCSFKWSPNQKKIVFAVGCVTAFVPGYSDLYLLDIASKTATPIVTSKEITGQADDIEAYFSPTWMDDETLWVGYFMRVSPESAEYHTRLYHLSEAIRFDNVGFYGMQLIAHQNKTLVASPMIDFTAYVGALEDIGGPLSITLDNVCDDFISPDHQHLAYTNCDNRNSVSLIDLETSDIQRITLPNLGGPFGWVVLASAP
jgi:Tol biopolymer transport system component